MFCPKCGATTTRARARKKETMIKNIPPPASEERITEITPPSEKKIICMYCGTKLSAYAVYCRNCGKKVTTLEEEQHKAKKSTSEIFEELLNVYASVYGRTRLHLEKKIDQYMKKGLSREDAIRKIAQDERI